MTHFTFRNLAVKALLSFALVLCGLTAFAQITTAVISGKVVDNNGEGLIGATVVATHVTSGTRYGTATNAAGRYTLPAVRVGGPFTLTITYTGFETETRENVYTTLGNTTSENFQLRESGLTLEEIAIVANRSDIFSSERTGASTNINDEMMATLPTLSRSLNDFLRLTPQSRSSSVAATTGSGVSFAGQDSRFNNLTIDGTIFNNSFGLASAPAGQTNSTPISLDAIEEIQVNIAPYDVRLSGFTGAGINAITRSGTNRFEGAVFANYRTEKFAGDSINVVSQRSVNGVIERTEGNVGIGKQDFVIKQIGFRLGGPIIKDKLFFFVNAEIERREDPATSFRAFRDETTTPSSDPNVTRVKASDLDTLRDYLINNFDYDPGRYENYPLETSSDKLLAKLDYNFNDRHHASVRFNYLRSFRDVLASQSGSFSDRRSNKFALNFEASNYIINNDIFSFIGELNSFITDKVSNNFQIGYTSNRDYRDSRGGIFPLVDILEGGRNYTTFGYEPFTPNNRLDTDTWQVKDDVSFFLGKHTVTAGANFEYFKFTNIFTPTYYGQYVYNSLADFYKDADNPGQDSVNLRRYQLTYSALEGAALPVAYTKVYMPGVYFQDEISFLKDDRLKMTFGMRVDIPIFDSTAYHNPAVDTMIFSDENNQPVQYHTDEFPKTSTLFSPRIGFNWDILGGRKVQLRGGTGIFSGRPAFVWLSNQVGNNGVLTGSFRNDNTFNHPFSSDVTEYIPENNSSPSSYNLALTDRNFKFPQIWRSNLAVDFKLPFDIAATIEYITSKNIHEVQYINANQVQPSGRFEGADNRPFFPGLGLSGTAQSDANRIINPISDAIVLKNDGQGKSESFTVKLERQFSSNFFAMTAYSYAKSKDLITAGSIAFSSWRDNRSVRGNNLPDLAYSDFDQTHRVIGALSYRLEYFKFGATTFSLFVQSGNQGRTQFTYNGDYNGDQLVTNDLVYIPNDASELTFRSLQSIADFNGDGTKDTVNVSAATQAAAFNEFLNGDEYLKENKGKYSERNGFLLPWLTTMDVTLQQEFFVKVGGRRHRLQFRADVYNFGNLLNNSWGVGDIPTNNAALQVQGKATGPNGGTIQRLSFGTIDTKGRYVAPTQILTKSASLNDVWQLQLGVRYIFD